MISYFLNTYKDFIYLFLDRGEGREKVRERNINVWLARMCPDGESNQRPFGSQVGTQSTEPHQPAPNSNKFCFTEATNLRAGRDLAGMRSEPLILQRKLEPRLDWGHTHPQASQWPGSETSSSDVF